MKINSKGFSAVGLIGVLLVLGIVVGVGAYVFNRDSESINNQAAQSHISKTEAESDEPSSELANFKSEYNKVTFKYPTSWKVEVEGIPEAQDKQAKHVTLTSPNGLKLVYSDFVSGLGGGCDDTSPKVSIDKTTSVPGASGVYVAEVEDTIG